MIQKVPSYNIIALKPKTFKNKKIVNLYDKILYLKSAMYTRDHKKW